MNNIINEFWQYVETQRNKKIGEKIYQWLNRDNLGSIIVDNKVYWTELTCSYSTFPVYAYNYIKKWAKKRGLTYLYDIPVN